MRGLRTLRIVAATIKEQSQSEKMYLGNFWANLSSTAMFTLTHVVFIDLLFRRTGTVAGYAKNDYFLMMLIGQVTFYIVSHFLAGPMLLIIDSVRNGYFDLMLLKPVATRTYIYARAVKPFVIAFVSLPNIILFSVLINWSELTLSVSSVLAGLVVWVCGLLIFNAFMFALTMPVFTQGDASDMLNAYYATMAITQMPYGQLPKTLKVFAHIFLPAILMTAAVTAVILMKISLGSVLLPALAAAVVAIWIKNSLWRLALRSYTSASS